MHVIRLPRLGQTMEAGVIRHWCFAEGDAFDEGVALYEVETEKAATEVEAKSAGVLVRILVHPSDDEIQVGTTLAVVADAGEAADRAAVTAFLTEQGITDTEVAAPTSSTTSEVVASTTGGPADHAPQNGKVKAVPKARRVARDLGIDLSTISPSGDRGYVRVEDVTAAMTAPAQADAAEQSAPAEARPAASLPAGAAAPATISSAPDPTAPPVPTTGPAPVDGATVSARIPLQGVARAMAETMARTAREVPQFVQQISVDAAALVARLKRLRYEGTHVTYTDLLVGALAHTAAEVPEVNASFAGTEIIRYADVNVAVAMATDRGLVVPVVPRATELSIAEIARATKELAEQARAGRIGLDQLSGGTISLSNLGAFGIDTGFPIVNAPQCALVFVGKLGQEPVVVDGRIEVGTRLQLAIAYDHRVVDGMTAARFTQAFRTRIEAGG